MTTKEGLSASGKPEDQKLTGPTVPVEFREVMLEFSRGELAALRHISEQNTQRVTNLTEALRPVQVVLEPQKITGIKNTTKDSVEEDTRLIVLKEIARNPVPSEQRDSYLNQFKEVIGGEWTERDLRQGGPHVYLPMERVICIQNCRTVHDLDGKVIIAGNNMPLVEDAWRNLGMGLESTSCSSAIYQQLKKNRQSNPTSVTVGESIASQVQSKETSSRLIPELPEDTFKIPVPNLTQKANSVDYLHKGAIEPPLTEEQIIALVLIETMYNEILKKHEKDDEPFKISRDSELGKYFRGAPLDDFDICKTGHTFHRSTGKPLYIWEGEKQINIPGINTLLSILVLKEKIDPKKPVGSYSCPAHLKS